MKPSISRHASEQGNLILVSLMVAGIAGITLGGYLMMTQQQNVSIYRSQTWNSSMAVTEAGIEDALQLVNRFEGSLDDLWRWTNYTSIDGWDSPAPNIYHVQRIIPTGGITNSYEVWVTNYNNAPTIYSSGTVPWTYLYASAGAQPIFADVAVGTDSGSGVSTTKLKRNVLVQTKYDPLFVVAMAALGNIDLNGNGVSTDSFDSGDPNYSNNGLYPTGDLNKTKANGDVCTDASVVDSLNVGNANVKGHVRTGNGIDTMSSGANCSVGDRAWVEGGTKGIKPGWSSTDFNVAFPIVQLPDGAALWPPAVPKNEIIDGVAYTYVFLTSGDYWMPVVSGGIYVGTNASVRLRITGSVSLSGSSDAIRLSPENAWLKIYMVGSSFSLSGSAVIDNMSGHAERFYLFGLPSCTSITFGGNGSFYGGVYAPQADFAPGGGGSDTFDFVGASVTKTVRMNGHFNFHYDENLAKIGPSRGYIPIAWKEL